jgi:tripartite-type tricarboxylate transporter receptor subunit TctC
MKPIRIAAALIAALFAVGPAFGQAYPSGPIKLIVPFPPGGGTDIVSRHVAKHLADSTGWTIVVENKAGAGGTIGLIEAARAAPDGHTIVMGQTDNLVVAPLLQKKLTLNPLKDLTPVAQVSSNPFLLMTSSDSKYKSMNDLVAAAKAAPGKMAYGTAGTGTLTHLVVELMQATGGFKMEQVPYKGATPAIADLLGGHIPMISMSIGSGMASIQGGKVRGLAVTSTQRSAALPDVPTLTELGFKDFEAMGWLGIFVPNNTPPAAIARLNAELGKVSQNPELRKTLLAQGIDARTSTPEQLATTLGNDIAKWRKIIETQGIKVE